jgi:DNA helicase-2/ATP-dependent DNA helicase PcrA
VADSIKLTPKQKEAVLHKSGPLLIIAGPGTGKTTVVAERIRHLIQDEKVPPSGVLALTFTEKAAAEMLGRIDEVMPLGYEEPWLSTFHAFCERILRENAIEVGLDPAYEILTPPEAWIFVRDHLFEFELEYFRPLGNPTKFIQGMLTLFSRAQDQGVWPQEYLDWAKGKRANAHSPRPRGSEAIGRVASHDDPDYLKKQKELAGAYKLYTDLKTKESKMDFGDLILWALKLFRDRPSVLRYYRKQFEHILVDEFQDTNFAQYELIKLLAPSSKSPNLVVVGDDDQSIYKWRGASISNIWRFKKDYKRSAVLVLDRTFRLHSGVFGPVYGLIQNNNPDRLEPKLGISKKLKTVGTGPEPLPLLAQTQEQEAELVVEKIEELMESPGYSFGSFAILARANAHLDPFVAALRRHGVPYQLAGNRGLFDQEEVKELIAVLRVIADPHDRLSWYQILSKDVWGIPAPAALSILKESDKKSVALWEVLGPSELAPVKIVKELQELSLKRSPAIVLLEFLRRAGYDKRLLENESVENQLKVDNINLFLGKVKTYETHASHPNVLDLVEWLDALIEAGDSPAQAEIEDVDTVNLLTVHAAKGLEFPVVFLVSLASDRFPTRLRRDPLELPAPLFKELLPAGDAHEEEERRLFFVGCTRARERLYLSIARTYGGVREKRPSPFFGELGIDIRDLPVEDHQGPLWQVEPAASRRSRAPSGVRRAQDLSKFSYSYFDDFNQCPLKFKYHYLLRIPVSPSRSQSFGMTLHRVLRDFHRIPKENQTLDYLLDLYQRHWIPLGYEGVEDHREAKRAGEKILRAYFKKHAGALGDPIFLEKGFTLKLGDVSVTGFIDRIDKTKEGFEIVDYKTSDKAASQKEADKNKQLTIYALAARDALGIEVSSLALYFLKSNEKVVTRRTVEQLEAAKEEIVIAACKIRESDFPAKPGILCHYCDFRRVCPAYKLAPPLR